jgi:hypothetical protein
MGVPVACSTRSRRTPRDTTRATVIMVQALAKTEIMVQSQMQLPKKAGHAMQRFPLFVICSILLLNAPARAQEASPVPTATPNRAMAHFTLPLGWTRAAGDSVAMEWRSPSGVQQFRVAKTGLSPAFDSDHIIDTVKAMLARMHFAQTDVSKATVCDGTQSVVRTEAKNPDGKLVMEQVIVQGSVSGAIITYLIPDGIPDPAIEKSILALCWP